MKWLYYRFLYQRLMRFAHKHDWHKMEKNPYIEPGITHYWCHWCGLRAKEKNHEHRSNITKTG